MSTNNSTNAHLADSRGPQPVTDNELTRLQSENAELKSELERERMRLAAVGTAALGYFGGCRDEYKSASLDDVLRIRTENAELKAKIERMEGLGPVRAWMRLWAFNGETPKKEKRENGRMVWPFKFVLLPITDIKCLPDDVPLYAAPPDLAAKVAELEGANASLACNLRGKHATAGATYQTMQNRISELTEQVKAARVK